MSPDRRLGVWMDGDDWPGYRRDHDPWGDVSLDVPIPGTDLLRINTVSEGLSNACGLGIIQGLTAGRLMPRCGGFASICRKRP